MNISSSTAIRIPDLQTGNEIIARLPLTDPLAAAREIGRILDGFLVAPPEHETHFRLLERVRQPAAFVAEELGKRYEDKPVPFGDAEEEAFREAAALWIKTGKAYASCAERASPESPQPGRFATLLHRCIHFTGRAILEHFRAHRQLPWGLWLDMHGYYGTAEDMGLATLPVPGVPEASAGGTHCAAAYLAFILCDMAGCYSLDSRDQAIISRWAAAWSDLAGVHPAGAGKTLPPLVIDLVQDVALRPVAECLHTDQIRYLDTSRLAAHIEHVRQQLRQRALPSQLALGDDCTARQCAHLLGHLASRWTQAHATRRFKRRATSGVIQVCTGFEEIHYFISGKEFRQPCETDVYSRRDFEDTFAMRFQENPRYAPPIRQPITATYSADTWEVVNQSADGFRLMRGLGGRKLAYGQLLALRPHDGDRFLLAQTTWLMQESRGGLIAGIRALPGLPAAICARPAAVAEERHEPYQRAFLMSTPNPAHAEQSLVLPAGWYRLGRVIEVFTDRAWRAYLKTVLDTGPDFERISFEVG
ncbi:MAG: hypothetical protein LBI87_08180 [Candidatus Accumulibacter sp.]|jgi:hypothetical protein|nr:hypothetical protein [Accumulibacter sp.]